ncbi:MULTISPECIES: crossover junction endodeoxyribonuclease RuvC [Thermoanaerobacterium]|uniref:Crossover junction endodeoxyribonuclease RuvC n=2 Tax=Thermoanaerobacterium TaxID=28895 RepID=W9EEY1_9THEO|nr:MULTISPECIES: crossover junction endodeoxyribonuclease RuvC [Thermoanaerobacterium]AFK86686.1 Crossover junction endodeoxyribonuclease ruvC [Thermoanaerobacterium saccharolyticum JW/SL-YS485]ETO38299.1 Crossover junction endodeoxyribonuclease ruvC [Thermoanaerobacterium aotearoense SCUT27]
MRIIGIDPGIAIMGYGVIDDNGGKFKVLEYGAITTPVGTEKSLRLKDVYDGVKLLIERYKPDVMAIEELFFNKNAKTVITIGEARGVAILAAVNCGIKVFEYTPLQVKQSVVGYGRAEKKQVQNMVKAILRLEEIPKPDDVADALAVALCHSNSNILNAKLGSLK